ncbi:hypothetical protein KRP22_006015 [Phytophthora ramorum]|nr:Ankyrin repeat domain-containing protein 12 [Phytophthora ramorum]
MFYIMGHLSDFTPAGLKRFEFSKSKVLSNFYHCPDYERVLATAIERVFQTLLRSTAGSDFPNDNNSSAHQNGCTPLNHAALLGHVKICELLITAGANINAAAHDGNTPLHKAAQGGRAEVIQLLLREGAGPFAVNKKQESAYTIASHRNHVQVAILLYPYSGETRV